MHATGSDFSNPHRSHHRNDPFIRPVLKSLWEPPNHSFPLPRLASLFIMQMLNFSFPPLTTHTSRSAQHPSTRKGHIWAFHFIYDFLKPSCSEANTCPVVDLLLHVCVCGDKNVLWQDCTWAVFMHGCVRCAGFSCVVEGLKSLPCQWYDFFVPL